VRRLPVIVAVAILLVSTALSVSVGLFASPAPSARPSAVAALPCGPAGSVAVASPSQSAALSSPSPSSSAAPSVGPTVLADVAIVPVTQYRSTADRISADEVAAVLVGGSGAYAALELVAADADAILGSVGATRPADAARLVLAPDAATLVTDLAAHRNRLAFLRADQVVPAVRALGWGNRSLFGVDRVRSATDWGLVAHLGMSVGAVSFDPATTWTLVAGGDILLDRGVAQTVKIKGKGVDFPFDGGTAEITGHCKDCSPLGWDLPYTKRTGNAGALRHLIERADLAIANFENPAPDAFRYHTSGTVFSADPKLIAGLANVGIDWVGIANNHIRDAGGTGLLQTIANLRRYGIAASGAGRNLTAARTPSVLTAAGVKVAFLAYDTIAKSYGATPTRIGSAQLSAKAVREDVAKARAAGARVVIVFPHWGTEYDPTPFKGQQALARAAIDAGADMVIGNHAHWAGAVETYKGRPIWYALGNFVFDQTWSEPTMEGVTLELTFQGPRLVQARMRPHIILDKAQPNFLDPAGDGRVVTGQIFDASKGLLSW
jgi:hypothetical protein